MTFFLATLLSGTYALAEPSKLDMEVQVEQLQENQQPKQLEPCTSCRAIVPNQSKDLACEDLYRLACAPGRYDDGTGVAVNSADLEGRLQQLRESSLKGLEAEFQKALQAEENAYFLMQILSTSGLDASPFCQKGHAEYTTRCIQTAAGALAKLAVSRVITLGKAPDDGFREVDIVLKSSTYQKIEEKFSKAERANLADKEMFERVENKIFPQVKAALMDRIRHYVSDPAARDLMLKKVSGITFEGSDCSVPDRKQISLSSLLVPNAFYDSEKNIFKYCNGLFLANQSEFQMVYVVAHEMSHSIDPCRVSQGPETYRLRYSKSDSLEQTEKEYPIPGLISCLRSKGSARAKRKEPVPEPTWVRDPERIRLDIEEQELTILALEKTLKSELSRDEQLRIKKTIQGTRDLKIIFEKELAGKTEPAPAPSSGPSEEPTTPICEETDQIGETVSDWLAMEILPEYMAKNHPRLTQEQYRLGYANTQRGLCQALSTQEDLSGRYTDPHLSLEERINRISLVNPKVRKQMGCPVTPTHATYCTAQPEDKK